MEDYEKKYKEALATAKDCLKDGTITSTAIDYISTIFPELKESEDERIRKELIRETKGSEERLFEIVTNDEFVSWLEKQGKVDTASYEIAEKEKYDFVSGQFIKCRKSFDAFKEGNSYWLEYIGNDNYIGRSDNILNQKFHITPRQLYCLFTQEHCPKEDNANAPTEYGKYVDECLNDASEHFFSEGEDKYSVADLFYAGVRCGKSWFEKQGISAKLSEEEQNSFSKGVLSNCALSFINYLDTHSYEGKMCVSNGECEDINYAFHNAMWDRLHRYYCKYIEKQGEQKPAVVDFNAKDWYVSKVDGKIHDITYNSTDKVEPKFKIGDVLCDKSCTTLNKNSQQNIKILDIRNDMYICNNCIFPISQQNEYELVTKKIEQKSAWSDEDERMYRMCVDAVEYYHTPEDESTIRDWLKSLKERNAWKPSKKQMETLEYYIFALLATEHKEVLFGLYNDLKRL